MKRQTIRAALVLAPVLAARFTGAAEPKPAEGGWASYPDALSPRSAILATPVVIGEDGESQTFFRSGGAARHDFEDMSERLKSPEGRAALRAELGAMYARMYQDIEQELGINASTKERLLDLLVEHQLRQLDASSMVHGDFDASLLKQADTETQKLASLRALLGQDGLDDFQFYEITAGERDRAKGLNDSLPNADKLQPEQKQLLVQLFAESNQRARERDLHAHLTRFPVGEELRSPEEMQRNSQLLMIEANEQTWRRALDEHPRVAAQAAEFLSPAQVTALRRMHEDETSRQRDRIEKERMRAGLQPQIPERADPSLVLKPMPRTPFIGDATFEFTVTVNRSAPVTHTHTGRNAKPILFDVGEGLWIEATPTMYEEGWLDVHLAFYEQVEGERRRIDKGDRSGTLIGSPDGTFRQAGTSTNVVTGSKGFAVKTSLRVRVP